MPPRTTLPAKTCLLYSFALWFPLLLATPLFVALNNVGDLHVSPGYLALVLSGACLVAVTITSGLLLLAGPRLGSILASLLLALATVEVLQGNIVHDLFSYEQFDGREIDWQLYGWHYWLEAGAFVAVFAICLLVFLRGKRPGPVLPLLLIGSSALLLVSAALNYDQDYVDKTEEVDPDVFAFSNSLNVIHLIADGMQSDITREALKSSSELREAFAGFTFFENHTGQFHGTAPSIPTLFNGEVFDLSKGFSFKRSEAEVSEKSYQRLLTDNGYRTDYVTINPTYCLEDADSCTLRPFNYFKSRGYFNPIAQPLKVSLGLVTDLTLFRHTPLYLKERIYRDGKWLFGAGVRDSFYSQYPDQVIREWTEHMHVSSDEPVYKLYHYIGTHIPPRWDAQCTFQKGLETTRENTFEQTYCILSTISRFLAELRKQGIYNETLIVLTGDHGATAEAYDLVGEPRNAALSANFVGHARPVFMVKRLGDANPLQFSDLPTTIIDVAPSITDQLGLAGDHKGLSVFSDEEGIRARPYRTYRKYKGRHLRRDGPIPYQEYRILGDARVAENWVFAGLANKGKAPQEYADVSSGKLNKFALGLGLDKEELVDGAAWVRGREFAFLISSSAPNNNHLRLGLRIPEEISNQSVRVAINNGELSASTPLPDNAGLWIEVSIPLNDSPLEEENNFIRVQFSEQVIRDSGEPASALLRSITLGNDS